MRANSLATRLFLSAAVWVALILTVTGFALSSLYNHSVERAFDRRLNLYLRTLIAEVGTPDDPKNPEKSIPALGEPLFELPLSGWYWQIESIDSAKQEARASRSLWDATLPRLDETRIPLTSSGVRLGYVKGPEDLPLRMVERAIVERARTHVGNHAHAIKTPLSVIINEANTQGSDPFAAKILEQGDVMRSQVAHHLERARIAARLTEVATITDIEPVIEALE